MIFYLHGPDTFRARQKLREIREKYKTTYLHAVNVQDFDCTATALEDVKNALSTISMFEQKKLLICRSVSVNEPIKEFLLEKKEYLEKDGGHIVVVYEEGEPASHPLFAWLKKYAKQQEFLLLPPARVKVWIAREFASHNLKATAGALEALALAGGNDLWRLSQEIRKITAWKRDKQDGAVKEADVELFVSTPATADVFATIEAVANKNKKRGLALMHQHLKKGDAPLYLFSMLQYQLRTVLQIRDMADRGFSEQEMIQKTKLHPYALKKGLRVAGTFPLGELKQAYERLFEAEKSIKTGTRDPEAALDFFVATL